LVDVVGHGPQLGRRDVVGQLLALVRRPRARPADPRVLERDHVVDVDVGHGRPVPPVVGREPCPRGGGAGRAGDDVDAVALEHVLADVARAALRLPVREELAVVPARVGEGFHRQGGEFGLRARLRGDSGLFFFCSVSDAPLRCGDRYFDPWEKFTHRTVCGHHRMKGAGRSEEEDGRFHFRLSSNGNMVLWVGVNREGMRLS